MLRSRILIPLAAVLAIGVAAPAGASTYCVNTPDCVAAGGVDKGNDANALSAALSSAQGAAGKDRVEVGAGTYARAGGFAYSGGAGNELDLVGAGHAQSALTSTTTGPTLNVTAPDSTVTGFGVVIPPTSSQIGLSLTGAQSLAKDIAVNGQAGTASGVGAVADGGATLADSTITGTGHQLLYGATGNGTLRDTTITTTDFSYGVVSMPEIHRVSIAAGYGILESGPANAKVDEVAISVPPGGIGIASSSTSFGDTVTTADHLTIVGAGDPGSEGAGAAATAGGANPHNGKLILRSSIVRSVGHALGRHASHGAADIEVDHSDVNLSTALTDVQAGGSGALTDKGGNVDVDPQFVSASDFRLLAGSPVIDQGAATVQAGESSTELGGGPRLLGPATDMGAFEFEPPAPPPPPSSGSTESGSGASESGTSGAAGGDPAAQAPVVEPAPPQVLPPGSPSFSLGRTITVHRPSTGSLKVTCKAAGPCAFTSKLTSGSKVIARARGSIAEGRAAQVTVKLTRAGRKLLAQRTKLRVKLTGAVTNPAGGRTPIAATATVRSSLTR